MVKADEWIPVAGPSITDKEVSYVSDAAQNAWFSDHYRFNSKFESMFASYIGVSYAASVPHCTSALHLALAAYNIGPGDEVIAPDVTWIASVAPITYVGAMPVLVGIDPMTWCIDIEQVEAAITPKTRAILAVNLYGSMADWAKLRDIADGHGLVLIEDAAEAVGSTYNGRQAGSFGDVSAFSFHASKTITTGEGGMICTNDPNIYARIQSLRDHGRAPGDRFFQNNEIAFKYKMSAMQAALGIAQMERIDVLVSKKRQIFQWYHDGLKDVPGLSMNFEPQNVKNSYWMVTVVPDERYKLDKFALQEKLRERNIDSRPFFSPLSSLKAFDKLPEAKRYVCSHSNADIASQNGVNLPSGYQLTEDMIELIFRTIIDVLNSEK